MRVRDYFFLGFYTFMVSYSAFKAFGNSWLSGFCAFAATILVLAEMHSKGRNSRKWSIG